MVRNPRRATKWKTRVVPRGVPDEVFGVIECRVECRVLGLPITLLVHLALANVTTQQSCQLGKLAGQNNMLENPADSSNIFDQHPCKQQTIKAEAHLRGKILPRQTKQSQQSARSGLEEGGER